MTQPRNPAEIPSMPEDQPVSTGTTYFLISVMLASTAALVGFFIATPDLLWHLLGLLS